MIDVPRSPAALAAALSFMTLLGLSVEANAGRSARTHTTAEKVWVDWCGPTIFVTTRDDRIISVYHQRENRRQDVEGLPALATDNRPGLRDVTDLLNGGNADCWLVHTGESRDGSELLDVECTAEVHGLTPRVTGATNRRKFMALSEHSWLIEPESGDSIFIVAVPRELLPITAAELTFFIPISGVPPSQRSPRDAGTSIPMPRHEPAPTTCGSSSARSAAVPQPVRSTVAAADAPADVHTLTRPGWCSSAGKTDAEATRCALGEAIVRAVSGAIIETAQKGTDTTLALRRLNEDPAAAKKLVTSYQIKTIRAKEDGVEVGIFATVDIGALRNAVAVLVEPPPCDLARVPGASVLVWLEGRSERETQAEVEWAESEAGRLLVEAGLGVVDRRLLHARAGVDDLGALDPVVVKKLGLLYALTGSVGAWRRDIIASPMVSFRATARLRLAELPSGRYLGAKEEGKVGDGRDVRSARLAALARSVEGTTEALLDAVREELCPREGR